MKSLGLIFPTRTTHALIIGKEWNLVLISGCLSKNTAMMLGLSFLSSPFSNMAVTWLEQVGVKRYKIGSGEVSNFLMLDKIAKTGKDIIISSGMSSFDELDESITFLKSYSNEISILQCTANIPHVC